MIPHITQIAAIEMEGGETFSSYVLPKLPIAESAPQVTGISMAGPSTMKVHKEPVTAVPVKQAVDKFIAWLQKFEGHFHVQKL